MFLSIKNKFKILHVFTHLMACTGLVWTIMHGHYQWILISFIWFLYCGIVGVNVALHRYFSHTSFQTNRFGHLFLLVSSFFPMLGSPAAWGSIHRYHHANSDQINDPHDPKRNGIFQSWFTIWPKIEIPLSLYRSFIKDKELAWFDRNYFFLIIFYVTLLFLVDWKLVSFIFAIPAVGCFHGAAAIAVIPHIAAFGGYRNYPTQDDSRNNFLAWIFSLGEGWHNNHHHNPKKFRHGEKWWEIDPPAFIIEHLFRRKE